MLPSLEQQIAEHVEHVRVIQSIIIYLAFHVVESGKELKCPQANDNGIGESNGNSLSSTRIVLRLIQINGVVGAAAKPYNISAGARRQNLRD